MLGSECSKLLSIKKKKKIWVKILQNQLFQILYHYANVLLPWYLDFLTPDFSKLWFFSF